MSRIVTMLFVIAVGVSQISAELLKPYTLVSNENGSLSAVIEDTKEKLLTGGFSVIGEVSPNSSAKVFVITNDELKKIAAQSTNGGFGAVIRVSITKQGNRVQVAYTNPAYWGAAFRQKGNFAPISQKLVTALGKGEPFGSEKGITLEKLKKYHYMAMMPYFTDVDLIGTASSHQEAIKKVEAGLAAKKGGVTQVYKLEIPGKSEVVYGVSLSSGDGADINVLTKSNKTLLQHTAYLPYELLVVDNKIIALQGKFRIAIAFPDLSMGTFMTISGAPKAIKNSLKAVVGTK